VCFDPRACRLTLLVSSTVAILQNDGLDPQPLPDLGRASALKISFHVGGREKTLTVSEKAELAPLLASLTIKQVDKDRVADARASCTLEFALPNEKRVRLYFPGEPDALQGRGESYGYVWIDKKFFEKLTEYVPKKEGRQINLLRNN